MRTGIADRGGLEPDQTLPGQVDDTLDDLERAETWGYHRAGTSHTEPTALAALAFAAYGRERGLIRANEWLVGAQNADGSVGYSAEVSEPGWLTALAVLAWAATPAAGGDPRLRRCTERACSWILATKGVTAPRSPLVGHDPSLVGWPWVSGTQSWVEPTALNVIALRACGFAGHPRSREATRLLKDRILPNGGCNYGNTFVLGRELLAQAVPTGLLLLALVGEADLPESVVYSREYLRAELSERTTSMSLGYGLLGLAAADEMPAEAGRWIVAALGRSRKRADLAAMALLCLAALGGQSPLVVRRAILHCDGGQP